MATDIPNAIVRRDQGFQMIGLASDTGFLIRGSLAALEAIGKRPGDTKGGSARQ
jgi:hypothetical protein